MAILCILGIAVTGLGLRRVPQRALQFFPVLADFTWRQVLQAGIGIQDLHLPYSTLLFGGEKEAVIGVSRIRDREPLANMLTKPITVFKLPIGHERSVPLHELKHSFSGNFPQNPLVRRVPGYENGAAPLEAAVLAFCPPHRLEEVIGFKIGPLASHLIFFKSTGIGGKQSDHWGRVTPIKLSWQMPAILEIDHKASFAFGFFRPKDIGHCSVWTAYRHVGLFSYYEGRLSILIRRFCGSRSFFGRAHLADVNDQQSESNENSEFFPKWCAILAPLGAVGIWSSWDNVRSEHRLRLSVSVFVARAILWMYGVARLITL